MPFKRVYHAKVCRFMEFLHGGSATYDINSTFTREELLEIEPVDIKRFFGLLAYNDPDYNIFPPANHRPVYCRSSSLETYKKGLSFYMPHRAVPYVNGVGNPTRSSEVNDIINEIKKFEVRGEGCKSSAKRPIREVEFRKQLELLRAQPSFECKYKYPALLTWQYHLIGRLDDCVNFEMIHGAVRSLTSPLRLKSSGQRKLWRNDDVLIRYAPLWLCACAFVLLQLQLSNSNSLS